MTDFLERWANDRPENARLVAQERLIAETAEAVWAALEHAGVTKTELADRMGTTRGYISQVLGGSRNMTLRTLADICHALDLKPTLTIHKPHKKTTWETIPSDAVCNDRGAGKIIYLTDYLEKVA